MLAIAFLPFTLLALSAPPVAGDHATKMARGLDLFKQHIRPLLMEKCVRCHGGKATESEFDLTDRDGLLKGGTQGPAVVAGNARDSLLHKLVTHARQPYMPHQRGKLPAEAIAHIAAWIDCGAPYDQPLRPVASASASWTQKIVAESARRFWSF